MKSIKIDRNIKEWPRPMPEVLFVNMNLHVTHIHISLLSGSDRSIDFVLFDAQGLAQFTNIACGFGLLLVI
jgi:hypothetical protein